MDLQKIAADIPDYQAFLTVDELNASSHRLVAAMSRPGQHQASRQDAPGRPD